MMPLRPWMSVPALSLTLGLPPLAADPPRTQARVAPQPATLSAESLQALVAGVTLYPDPVIELLLDAAKHPQALHRVASAGALPGRQVLPVFSVDEVVPPPVQRLLDRHPDLLAELDRNLVIAGLLGRMYEQQPEQVWTAIREVQQQIAQLLPNAPQPIEVNGLPVAPPVWAAQQIARRLSGPTTMAELQRLIGPGAPNLPDESVVVRSNVPRVAEATNAVSHSRQSLNRTPTGSRSSLVQLAGTDTELQPALAHLQHQFAALHQALNQSAGTTARTIPPADSQGSPGGNVRTVPRPMRRVTP
jgi:hypothetical protein